MRQCGKMLYNRGMPQMTIWHMHSACWILKATNTHTGCVILIAFPLQQWLCEGASMLHYAHFACLVNIYLSFTLTDIQTVLLFPAYS